MGMTAREYEVLFQNYESLEGYVDVDAEFLLAELQEALANAEGEDYENLSNMILGALVSKELMAEVHDLIW